MKSQLLKIVLLFCFAFTEIALNAQVKSIEAINVTRVDTFALKGMPDQPVLKINIKVTGSSGTLSLEKAEKYLLTCTFQTGNLLGLDVRDHATVDIRAQGVLAIGLPSGILLWLFSLGFTPKEKTSLGSLAE